MDNEHILKQLYNNFIQNNNELSENNIIKLMKLIQENIISRASSFIIEHYLSELSLTDQLNSIQKFKNKILFINE
jgi:hypothetical protein